MTPADDDARPAPDAGSPATEPEWKRRRRLEAVFGEGLPEQTRDDRDRGASSGKGDEWYHREVPPHHG